MKGGVFSNRSVFAPPSVLELNTLEGCAHWGQGVFGEVAIQVRLRVKLNGDRYILREGGRADRAYSLAELIFGGS